MADYTAKRRTDRPKLNLEVDGSKWFGAHARPHHPHRPHGKPPGQRRRPRVHRGSRTRRMRAADDAHAGFMCLAHASRRARLHAPVPATLSLVRAREPDRAGRVPLWQERVRKRSRRTASRRRWRTSCWRCTGATRRCATASRTHATKCERPTLLPCARAVGARCDPRRTARASGGRAAGVPRRSGAPVSWAPMPER